MVPSLVLSKKKMPLLMLSKYQVKVVATVDACSYQEKKLWHSLEFAYL